MVIVYHLWLAERWRELLGEFVDRMDTFSLAGPLHLGLVGDRRERSAAVLAMLGRGVPLAEADTGWEQVTLSALRHLAGTLPPDEPVLYCHSKGVGGHSEFADRWRTGMTRLLVGDWRYCTHLLTTHDLVTCHWLTEKDWHAARGGGKVGQMWSPWPFPAGNMWWARAGYLARLPEPSTDNRFQAEKWVGLGDPRVFDLAPGPPTDYYRVAVSE